MCGIDRGGMSETQNTKMSLILKLNEIMNNASHGIKYFINKERCHEDKEYMINVIVSLLNFNIKELNDIMKEVKE